VNVLGVFFSSVKEVDLPCEWDSVCCKFMCWEHFIPVMLYTVLETIISMGNIIFFNFSSIFPWDCKADSVGKGLDANRTSHLSRFVMQALASAEGSMLLCTATVSKANFCFR